MPRGGGGVSNSCLGVKNCGRRGGVCRLNMGWESAPGGVRGGDARGDSGRGSGCAICACDECPLEVILTGGSAAGVVVSSGDGNRVSFTVGVLVTAFDSSSLAETWQRERGFAARGVIITHQRTGCHRRSQ